MNKEEILVVEDEAKWQRELKRILEKKGYRVSVAGTYLKAMEAIERGTAKAAVVDLSLGVGDPSDRQGLNLLDKIQEKDEYMAVICVTGYGTVEESSDAVRKNKAFAFIGKSNFDVQLFTKKLKEAIKSAKIKKKADDVMKQILTETRAMKKLKRRLM